MVGISDKEAVRSFVCWLIGSVLDFCDAGLGIALKLSFPPLLFLLPLILPVTHERCMKEGKCRSISVCVFMYASVEQKQLDKR